MTQPLDERLAGRGRRLVATLIDMLLVPALTVLLVMITGVMEDAEDYRNSMWMRERVSAGGGELSDSQRVLAVHARADGWQAGDEGGDRCDGVRRTGAVLEARLHPRAVLSVAVHNDQSDARRCCRSSISGFVFRKNRRCVHDLAAGTSVVRV